MIPSVKTIMRIQRFRGLPLLRDQAKAIRAAMELAEWRISRDPGSQSLYRRWALEKISDLIEGYGIERIEPGYNSRSPGILYVNMGDTYDTTVLVIRGRFRVGCWGDVVERGNYA